MAKTLEDKIDEYGIEELIEEEREKMKQKNVVTNVSSH